MYSIHRSKAPNHIEVKSEAAKATKKTFIADSDRCLPISNMIMMLPKVPPTTMTGQTVCIIRWITFTIQETNASSSVGKNVSYMMSVELCPFGVEETLCSIWGVGVGWGDGRGSMSHFLKVFHETAKMGSQSRLKVDIPLCRFDQKLANFEIWSCGALYISHSFLTYHLDSGYIIIIILSRRL